jgi:serine protease SohB
MTSTTRKSQQVSLLGEITEKGRKKFVEQIEDTHHLFKEFVQTQRPQLDLAAVATGEYWFGQRALELKLCDKLMSSDEYLFSRHKDAQILEVNLVWRQTLGEKIAHNFAMIIERGLLSWWQKTYEQSLFNR